MQNINGIQNVFLIPSYIQVELILINLSWIFTILLSLLYVYLRWKKIVFKQAQFFPLLFKGEFSDIGEDNKRYVKYLILLTTMLPVFILIILT